MAYQRVLFEDAEGTTYFAKAHDPSLLSEDWRRDEMVYFLEKEARIYRHLEMHGFQYAPTLELFENDMLVLKGLTEEEGWYWRAPTDTRFQQQYFEDISTAFRALEEIPAPPPRDIDEVSIDTFYDHGWDKLHDTNTETLIRQNLLRWEHELDNNLVEEAELLVKNIGSLAIKRINTTGNTFNHHDARQSNIAWHPDHGARIVDWSWADNGLEGGDTTMLLLDLHKSQLDVAENLNHLNPVYAKMILGYWLQRSQTEHMEGNDNVRMHQFISAVKAGTLLVQHLIE